jgi:hypothetical protein
MWQKVLTRPLSVILAPRDLMMWHPVQCQQVSVQTMQHGTDGPQGMQGAPGLVVGLCTWP